MDVLIRTADDMFAEDTHDGAVHVNSVAYSVLRIHNPEARVTHTDFFNLRRS
jgi:hypothetical protein